MIDLMSVDPRAAASFLLSEAERSSLMARGALDQHVERREIVSGVADVFYVDSADWSTSALAIRVGGKEAYTETSASIKNGSTVRIEGLAFGDSLLATSVQELQPRMDQFWATTGNLRVAVIALVGKGDTAGVDMQMLRNGYFAEDTMSVTTHYLASSYGKLHFTGAVFGPFEASRSYGCSELGTLLVDALAMAKGVLDSTQFDRLIVDSEASVFADSCSWGGVGGGSFVFLRGLSPTGQVWSFGAIHELGHTLTLPHARSLESVPGALSANPALDGFYEYGDSFSHMGHGKGQFLASEKLDLGWLQLGSDIRQVNTSGVYRINNLAQQSGVRALNIRRKDNQSGAVWLEYRRQDRLLDPEVPSGGAIVMHYKASSNPLEVRLPAVDRAVTEIGTEAILMPGRIWQDLFSGLTIEVVEVDPIEATLRISFDDSCARIDHSQVALDSARQEFSVAVTASDSCVWSIVGMPAWLELQGPSGRIGSGNVVFHVPATKVPVRESSVAIGRQVLSVKQISSDQTEQETGLRLRPESATAPAQSGSFSVTAIGLEGLAFGVKADSDWIKLGSPDITVFSGSAVLTYMLEENPNLASRNGQIIIGSRTFEIRQLGRSNIEILPGAASLGPERSYGKLLVETVSSDTSWNVLTDQNWLRVMSGSSRVGSGTVEFETEPNPSTLSRKANIIVGQKVFPVTQRGLYASATSESVSLRAIGGMDGTGDGRSALEAVIDSPGAIAVDADGNVAIADVARQNIRLFGRDGVVTTLASAVGQVRALVYTATGDLLALSSQGLLSIDANGRVKVTNLNNIPADERDGAGLHFVGIWPLGITTASDGAIFLSANNKIYKFRADGTLERVAGTGQARFDGEGWPAIDASLWQPRGMAVGPAGELYVADQLGQRVHRIGTDGVLRTIAGNGHVGVGGDGIRATESPLYYPQNLFLDPQGNVYVSTGNHIRRISADGVIDTVIGIPGGPSDEYLKEGPALKVYFRDFIATARAADGTIYGIEYSTERVRRVRPDGNVELFAGLPADHGDGGPALGARLLQPSAISADEKGGIYVLERIGPKLRYVSPDGRLSTLVSLQNGDADPVGLAASGSSVFFSAPYGPRVYRFENGTTTAVAGNGGSGGFSGDGDLATSASLNRPTGLAVGTSGDLYIADTWNQRIRRIGSDGVINTVAGGGSTEGPVGTDGPAKEQRLYDPLLLASNKAGQLAIAEVGYQLLQLLDVDGTLRTLGRAPDGYFFGGISDDGNSGILYTAYPLLDGPGLVRWIGANGASTTLLSSSALEHPTGINLSPLGKLFVVDRDTGVLYQGIRTSSTIQITTNPITDCDQRGLGRALLEFHAIGVPRVMIRVGDPPGPGAPATDWLPPDGTFRTDYWVQDQTHFLLSNDAGEIIAAATARLACPGN
ncbi:MAG: hypothetical protein J0H49_30955 [Acidobacteria bacterium]|nr:hypothetical protein [Acidobacteriota bacterium]